MTSTKQRLGQWGERLAADYLIEQGYLILDRNVRTKYGEIDLIASKDKVTVFIEVKTRRSTALGFPEISVDRKKQKKLVETAQAFIQEKPDLGDAWRIDVIAIRYLQTSSKPEIVHFENAVSESL